MRVVVIGAGKLGYSIAELMSNEQYDVVFIDIDEQRLEQAKNTLDVLTICSAATSQTLFMDPDVKGADMVIAVTDSDETNMVASLMAKHYGIHHTVARIRDAQLFRDGQEFLKQSFHIDQIINPEMITAREIRRDIMTPAALDVEDFAGGKVRLFEAKIRRGSRFDGVMLKDLKLPRDVLAAMIFRDNHMIIPHGNDALMAGDNAYFVGNPASIELVSSSFVHRTAKRINRVLIVGAGRTGRMLASMLEDEGLRVKIIDSDPERCQLAADRLKSSLIINGDASNIDLLNSEGAGDTDVAICLTEDDKLNLMLALLLKHMGAEKTVVRIARSEYVDLMKQVGVDIAVSSRLLSAAEVLAFARRGGVVAVSLLEGAKAEAIEVKVQRGAPVIGKSLSMAQLPKECLVCSVVHDEEAHIANGSTVLSAGDTVILILDTRYSNQVMEYFKGTVK